MRITLESTNQIVELNGVRCRVWAGTVKGPNNRRAEKVQMLVAHIGTDSHIVIPSFEKRLKDSPSPANPVILIPGGRLIV